MEPAEHGCAIHIDPPFPLDIIVRTPKNINWRLEDGDLFHTEIVSKGKVLYEKDNQGVGAQGQRDYRAARKLAAGKEPFHDQLCFFCQQAAEKDLKA